MTHVTQGGQGGRGGLIGAHTLVTIRRIMGLADGEKGKRIFNSTHGRCRVEGKAEGKSY